MAGILNLRCSIYLSLLLIIWSALAQDENQDEIVLTYVMKTKDSFYAGQALNVSCYFPNLSEDGLLILSLSFKSHGFLCQREAGGVGWEHTRLGGDFPSDILYDLTNDDCNLPAAGNTMTVWFTITEALLNLEFVCTNLITQNKSSASLQINEILEPPKNLTMTVTPDPVTIGQLMNVSCTSSSSASSYKYELFRPQDNGLPVTLPNGQRNLTYADWDGFYVRCLDESNPDWPVHDDIVKELLVKPFDNSTAPIARPDAYSGVSTVKTGPAGSDTVRLQAHRIRLPCYFVAASVLLWKFGFTS